MKDHSLTLLRCFKSSSKAPLPYTFSDGISYKTSFFRLAGGTGSFLLRTSSQFILPLVKKG